MSILEKYATILEPLLQATNMEEYSQAVNAHFYNNLLFHKVNVSNPEGGTEGVWVAFISEDDHAEYAKDSETHTYIGILLNKTLWVGYSWGIPLLCKCSGSARPVNVRDQSILSEYTDHLQSLLSCT